MARSRPRLVVSNVPVIAVSLGEELCGRIINCAIWTADKGSALTSALRANSSHSPTARRTHQIGPEAKVPG